MARPFFTKGIDFLQFSQHHCNRFKKLTKWQPFNAFYFVNSERPHVFRLAYQWIHRTTEDELRSLFARFYCCSFLCMFHLFKMGNVT